MLVGGSDLDLDNVSVARTTIPHAGGMGFRSLAPTDGEGATPVRRPGAVIVTHDGLGFAVTECDEVGGHRGFPFDRGGGLNPAHGAMWRGSFDHPLLVAPKRHQARVETGFTTGHSTYAREATQMPRRWRSSTEAVSKPSGRGTLAEASVPRLTSRLMSAVSPPIDGLILAARRRPIRSDCGTLLRALPALAPSDAAEDAGHPESQHGAEADCSHADPPNPGRKIVHGVVSPLHEPRLCCARDSQ